MIYIVLIIILVLIIAILIWKKREKIKGGFESNYLKLKDNELEYLPGDIRAALKLPRSNDYEYIVYMEGSKLMCAGAYKPGKVAAIVATQVEPSYRGSDCIFEMYNLIDSDISIDINDKTVRKYYIDKGFKKMKGNKLILHKKIHKMKDNDGKYTVNDSKSEDNDSKSGGKDSKTKDNGGKTNVNDSKTNVNNSKTNVNDSKTNVYNDAIKKFSDDMREPLKPLVMFSDIKGKLPYSDKPMKNIKVRSVHIGQRKLFLNELQLFTRYPEGVVIYAGAAPSAHLQLILDLFPKLKFILVDPNPFAVKGKYITANDELTFGSTNVIIINDLFTDELAEKLGKLFPSCIFLSDIRTDPNDLHITWNMAQQYIWYKILKPKVTMFKFRHMFYNIEYNDKDFGQFKDTFSKAKELGIDFIQNFYDKKLIYPKGTVYLQIWPGTSSTETRLVIDGDQPEHNYGDYKDYEDTMFYYNFILRNFGYFTNPLADKKIGFDHCADCSMEYQIWEDYKTSINPQFNILDGVKNLSKLLHKGLLIENHGHLYKITVN